MTNAEKNNEIFENIEGVMLIISEALKRTQTPHP
jgi:hypothetical protein